MSDPIVVQGPTASSWMIMPPPGFPLGDDGRTIRAAVRTRTEHGTTTVSEWDLSLEREE